jgi:hypothetical protein
VECHGKIVFVLMDIFHFKIEITYNTQFSDMAVVKMVYQRRLDQILPVAQPPLRRLTLLAVPFPHPVLVSF